jgi:hypothetical protein
MKGTCITINKSSFWLLQFLILTLLSCELINPEEDVTSYIYINNFTLATNPGIQGSASAKITEAWLFLDGDFLGAYSLPATVPLLTEGSHTIRLEPGIRDNGISSTPEVYPFYENYETTVALTAGETDTLRPVTQYRTNAQFIFVENFERSDHLFRDVKVGAPDTRVDRIQQDAFEGSYSGILNVGFDQPEVLIATSRRFVFPDEIVPTIYLEMNYRSEGLVGFGIIGYDGQSPIDGEVLLSAGFRPSEEWNKIYFNLNRVFANRNFLEYQVVFQAAIPQEEGTYIAENVRIWLDNIKLIQF